MSVLVFIMTCVLKKKDILWCSVSALGSSHVSKRPIFLSAISEELPTPDNSPSLIRDRHFVGAIPRLFPQHSLPLLQTGGDIASPLLHMSVFHLDGTTDSGVHVVFLKVPTLHCPATALLFFSLVRRSCIAHFLANQTSCENIRPWPPTPSMSPTWCPIRRPKR